MNKNFTQEQWFHEKLSETATPPWKEGWESLFPMLEETRELPLPPLSLQRKKRYATAAAIALLTGFSLWGLWQQPHDSFTPTANTITHLPEVQQKTDITTLTGIPTPVFQGTSSVDDRALPMIAIPMSKIKIPSPLPILPKAGKHPAFETIKPVYPVPLKLRKVPDLASAPAIEYNKIEIATHTKDKREDKPVSQWHISLKINANNGTFAGDPSANFNPVLKGAAVEVYPSVYVSRELSRHFSLQTGIALVSPVDIRHQDLNRTVSDPVRAMAANVSASEDNMQLSRLYYMDIPVTMRYRLNKKLSINSGLQVSVLEKVIGQKQRLDYDQYGTLALADPQKPLPENLSGTTSAKDIVNPLDVRGVIGLQYMPAKRWSAAIEFQYGLTDISKNRTFLNDHTNRNSVLKASIGFLIR